MKKPGIKDIVKKAWETECEGSTMFKVAAKIKMYRLGIQKWSRQQHGNAVRRIQAIKEKMEILKEQGGQRDWERWNKLREQLESTYKEEEAYWSQKERIQLL